MALKCGKDNVYGGLYTGINTRHIYLTSKMVLYQTIIFLSFPFFLCLQLMTVTVDFHHLFQQVEEYSGLQLQPHKAIVGANAFAHESGIHQVSVKLTDTYIPI